MQRETPELWKLSFMVPFHSSSQPRRSKHAPDSDWLMALWYWLWLYIYCIWSCNDNIVLYSSLESVCACCVAIEIIVIIIIIIIIIIIMAGVKRGGGCADLRRDEFATRWPRQVQVTKSDRITWNLWPMQHWRHCRQSTRYVSLINQSIETIFMASYVVSESEAHKWQRL